LDITHLPQVDLNIKLAFILKLKIKISIIINLS
jgi:hypothetical protein